MKYLLPFLLSGLLWAEGMSVSEALEKAEESVAVTKIIAKEIQSLDATKSLVEKGTPPELEIGTENFGISEFELVLSKELRHKSQIAPLVAEVELAKAQQKLEAKPVLLELHQKVVTQFIELATVEASVKKVDSILVALAEELTLLEKRVKFGAASEFELLEHQQMVIDMEEQGKLLRTSAEVFKAELAPYVGEKSVFNVPTLDSLDHWLQAKIGDTIAADHPALTALDIVIDEADLIKKQQLGLTKPSIAISGGYKRANESNENALLLGVSIGFANKSEAALATAEAKLKRDIVALEKEEVERLLLGELKRLAKEEKLISVKVETLLTKRIPLVQKLVTAAEARYAQGAISLYDIVRYRKDLFALQLEEVSYKRERALLHLSQVIHAGNLLN